jgi:hypothetical protein
MRLCYSVDWSGLSHTYGALGMASENQSTQIGTCNCHFVHHCTGKYTFLTFKTFKWHKFQTQSLLICKLERYSTWNKFVLNNIVCDGTVPSIWLCPWQLKWAALLIIYANVFWHFWHFWNITLDSYHSGVKKNFVLKSLQHQAHCNVF